MVIMLKERTVAGENSSSTEAALVVRTFAQALHDKYIQQEELDDKLCLPKDKTITTEITFVGFGTVASVQKQLKQLTSIDLSGMRIKSCGDLSDLQGNLGRVKTLNLADNLLSWNDIITILPYVPNLKELIITNNNLGFVGNIKELPLHSRRGIDSLTMGHTGLNWSSIVEVLTQIWSHVELLDLWDCKLESECMKLICHSNFYPTHFLNNLIGLKLSHNIFPDMSWISDMGTIHKLTELDISHCHLKSISIGDAIVEQLSNLRILNISYNDLVDWKSIATLYYLKNLEHLICHENPVYISEKFAKPFAVGRLGKLKLLNREEVTSMQRRDSEILYLRKTFLEYQTFAQGDHVDFRSHHPRYEELVEYYGIPEDLIKQKKIEKYITLDFCLGDKTITKKLPCDMRIVNVKMLCKRLFSLRPSSTLHITCCDTQASGSDLNYELDKDGQTLHFFSVKSGHKLLLHVD